MFDSFTHIGAGGMAAGQIAAVLLDSDAFVGGPWEDNSGIPLGDQFYVSRGGLFPGGQADVLYGDF